MIIEDIVNMFDCGTSYHFEQYHYNKSFDMPYAVGEWRDCLARES